MPRRDFIQLGMGGLLGAGFVEVKVMTNGQAFLKGGDHFFGYRGHLPL